MARAWVYATYVRFIIKTNVVLKMGNQSYARFPDPLLNRLVRELLRFPFHWYVALWPMETSLFQYLRKVLRQQGFDQFLSGFELTC